MCLCSWISFPGTWMIYIVPTLITLICISNPESLRARIEYNVSASPNYIPQRKRCTNSRKMQRCIVGQPRRWWLNIAWCLRCQLQNILPCGYKELDLFLFFSFLFLYIDLSLLYTWKLLHVWRPFELSTIVLQLTFSCKTRVTKEIRCHLESGVTVGSRESSLVKHRSLNYNTAQPTTEGENRYIHIAFILILSYNFL